MHERWRAWLMMAAMIAMLRGWAGASDAPTSDTMAMPPDVGAKLFLARCAGCHTVGGGDLTGPDLLASTRWARPDLWAGIKRMESKAGPLTDGEIDTLADLLLSSEARARLETAQQVAAAAEAVQLAAPSAAAGEALFEGRRALANGGPPCAACHAVAGRGGNLGPDLSRTGALISDMALRSGIERANYLVMKPVYQDRPVSAQEAAHIAEHLRAVAASPAGRRREVPVVLLGLLGAGVGLGFLAAVGRRRSAGVRERLVQQANER